MNKKKIIGVVILFGVFFGSLFWRHAEAVKINLNRQFNGTIENVIYDEKDIPTVTVDGEQYSLGVGYDFQHKIQQGDSMIKSKGSRVYKLIKKGSGLEISFE